MRDPKEIQTEHTSELIRYAATFYAKNLELMRKKNHDYAGDEEGLGNILACEELGLCPATTGLLTRILDKVKRLINHATGEEMTVEDESVVDTWQDLANYAAIGSYLHERKNSGQASKEVKKVLALKDKVKV